MKLFLTSKGLINKNITDHFLELAGAQKEVSMITTGAMEYKAKNRNVIALQEKLIALDFKVKLIDVEYDDPSLLDHAEIIVLNGGNPYYLMHHLRSSGTGRKLQEKIKANCLVMGICAGFLVLMKDLAIIDVLTPQMNTIQLMDKRCLGIVNEVIIPHYDRFVKEGRIKEDVVRAFESKSRQEVIRLGDYQGIKYLDRGREIIGTLQK